ncbi:hypothetical protein MSAN_00274400 [Mycena sanguinolenta]|uniref:Uncharacterized protein n=1 Tax=Mycena sanguinolenta TaxID=230812 RepID=A0A8H6ZL87_9AGAR|nr:hypothetical protein MSAN_00274400 [Mycena sanguinolenta]
MHTLFEYFIIFTVAVQLPQLSLATWLPGKAAQINFYVGGTCAQYTAEVESWWTSSPLVGGNGAVTGAECFLLSMPGDSTGINTAMMWEQTTTSDIVEPAQANGWCMFWDGFNCTGNAVSSLYAPAGLAGGPCQSSWSKDGFMWKSGRCFIDAAITPAPPQATTLSSTQTSISTTSNTTSTSPSATSSISHTSTTFASSTHLSKSRPAKLTTSSHVSTTVSSSASPSGYSSSISAPLASSSPPPQSNTLSIRKPLSSGTIAGVAFGTVSLVVVAIVLAFCIRRRGRKKQDAILPYLLMSERHSPEAHRRSHTLQILEKSRGGTRRESQLRSPTSGSPRRDQSAVANELRALRDDVNRLNSAMTGGDDYGERIRALERELQSYADPPLPGYQV